MSVDYADSIGALFTLKKAVGLEGEQFAASGFRFGTVDESWLALHVIAEAFRKGEAPDPMVMEWFAAAVDRCPENDPVQLVRELGLYVHGRRRKVDPDLVARRVQQLITGGASIMAACEQAAEELGCASKTAYRWHRDFVMTKQKALAKALREYTK